MISTREVATALRRYLLRWPLEEGRQQLLRHLVDHGVDVVNSHTRGHVVCSAVVLGPSGRVLVRTAGRDTEVPTMTPEVGDESLPAAARRAVARAGRLRLLSEIPLDIDLTLSDKPDHFHWQLRYVFRHEPAEPAAAVRPRPRRGGLVWVELDALDSAPLRRKLAEI